MNDTPRLVKNIRPIGYIGIVILITLTVFISQGALVFADHYSQELIDSKKKELKADFDSGKFSEEDYKKKFVELTEAHGGRDLYSAVDGGKRKIPDDRFPSKLVFLIGLGPLLIPGYLIFNRMFLRKRNLIKRMRIQAANVGSIGTPMGKGPETANKNVTLGPLPEQKGLFSTLGASLRDKTRDDMANNLQSLGIEATMAERGRAEEEIRGYGGLGLIKGSLGIIDVANDNLVVWINVVRTKRRDRHGPARYRTVFGIPDSTVPMDHTVLKIKTVRKKSFPLFGKVIDVHWEAADALAPLVTVFSEDEEVGILVKEIGDIAIYTHPEIFQGWTIELAGVFEPTAPHWVVLRKIAGYLVTSPRN